MIKDDERERGYFEQKIKKWTKIHICLVKEVIFVQQFQAPCDVRIGTKAEERSQLTNSCSSLFHWT